MPTPELISVITRLSVGAIATFLAILLWSNTREPAWMLVVLGVILRYAEILYDTFALFGIVPSAPTFAGVPIVSIALENAPFFLFGAAFIVMLARRRIR